MKDSNSSLLQVANHADIISTLGMTTVHRVTLVSFRPTQPNNREDITDWSAKSEAGFALIELLVVIDIISILAAMLLLALSEAKMKAQGRIISHSCSWR